MFLENLTDGEKSAFLGLAHKLVQVDGLLRAREEQVLGSLTALADRPAAERAPSGILLRHFQTRKAKGFRPFLNSWASPLSTVNTSLPRERW